MMKWEIYKTLNKQQKEEYDYKFKTGVMFPINSLISNVITLVMISMLFIFVCYLIFQIDTLSIYKDDIQYLMQTASRIIVVTMFLIIYYMFEYSVKLFIYSYKYSKWKKLNNIKSRW